MDKKILRIIDANINRLLEGLRVSEETQRFITNNKELALGFKKLRHKASALIKKWNIPRNRLLGSRDILRDVGRCSIKSELKRNNCFDIAYANIQRAKESLRVLEEFSKLSSSKISLEFKKLRYKIYHLEKKTAART